MASRNGRHPARSPALSVPSSSRKKETSRDSVIATVATAAHRHSRPHRNRPATDESVPAGRRWNQRAASRIKGSSTAIDRNPTARSASGPKLASPSAFTGRPASSAAVVTAR